MTRCAVPDMPSGCLMEADAVDFEVVKTNWHELCLSCEGNEGA
jgi:hypothetical protein